MWRVRARLSLRRPDDPPGTYSQQGSWDDASGMEGWMDPQNAGLDVQAFSQARPMSELSAWDERLLVDGSLQVRVELQPGRPLQRS